MALPGVWMAADGQASGLPWNTILIDSGLWSSRLLVVVLAVSPLRQLFRWHWLARHRRMVGLFAAFYAAVHLVAYVVVADYDWAAILAEIGRPYLAIGLVSAILLIPLTVTSTAAAMRRMGIAGWRSLHRLVYPAVLLALLHFYLTGKIDPWEAIVQSGLVLWLLLYRLAPQAGPRSAAPSHLALVLIGCLATALTLAIDLAHFQYGTGVGAARVIGAYLNPQFGLRPGHVVAAASLLLVLARVLPPLVGIGRPSRRPA